MAKHLSITKLPRIDKTAMNTEIKSSLNLIATTRNSESSASTKIAASAKHAELPSETIDILKRVADLGDKGYSVEDLAKYNLS